MRISNFLNFNTNPILPFKFYFFTQKLRIKNVPSRVSYLAKATKILRGVKIIFWLKIFFNFSPSFCKIVEYLNFLPFFKPAN